MKKIKQYLLATLIITAILYIQNDEYKTNLIECEAGVKICSN